VAEARSLILYSNQGEQQMMSFLHAGRWTDSAQSFWTGAGALWVFSAAVSAMDPPKTGDGSFYRWLYRFTHLLAANLDRALRPVPTPEQQSHAFSNKETE
jgi:hypothetical protein